MSREETKECIKVMQAYVDGKEIEVNFIGNDWVLANDPLWDFVRVNYRIKKEPEYVPFTFEDAEMLIGKNIKSIEESDDFLFDTNWCKFSHVGKIIGVLKNNVSIGGCITDVGYDELLEKYTFLDGTPCGKLKTIE